MFVSVSSGDSTDIPATLTRAAEEKKKGYKKKQQEQIPKDSPSTTKTVTEQPISEKPTDEHLLKKPVVRFHVKSIWEVNKICILLYLGQFKFMEFFFTLQETKTVLKTDGEPSSISR